LPSKNEIWSAKVAHLARHAAQYSTVTGPVSTDMAVVRQRKRDMVDRQIAAHLQNYKVERSRIDLGGWAFYGAENARCA
jgi:pyruvate/2-oxoglutarate dehydrogenase complex dihydrolipoamide dehydrogenase (E3) component